MEEGFHSKVNFQENVEYELRDKFGNLKPLFNENKLGVVILKTARLFNKNPITADGVVKKGWLNSLAAYGIQLDGITGKWGYKKRVSNLLTSAGKAGLASRVNGDGAEAVFTYVAVGTGTTAAAIDDTTLQTESAASGLSRAAGTASRITTTVTNDTAQVLKAFSATGAVAVTEAGLLNAASVGTLLARQVFAAINVVNGDSLTMTWRIQAS